MGLNISMLARRWAIFSTHLKYPRLWGDGSVLGWNNSLVSSPGGWRRVQTHTKASKTSPLTIILYRSITCRLFSPLLCFYLRTQHAHILLSFRVFPRDSVGALYGNHGQLNAFCMVHRDPNAPLLLLLSARG